MLDILRESPWPGLIIWVALYISDYVFTVTCARMYKAQDKIIFEGSFEITPYFQKDIDALKAVSPRFVLMLVISTAVLWFIWWNSVEVSGLPGMYYFAFGALVMLELVVHIRHLRNWFLFSRYLGEDGVQGRIVYPRRILLRMSAFELLVFSMFLLFIFAMTGSWLILGGATTCSTTALKHYRLARKHAATNKAHT